MRHFLVSKVTFSENNHFRLKNSRFYERNKEYANVFEPEKLAVARETAIGSLGHRPERMSISSIAIQKCSSPILRTSNDN
uniref:Uncharacterized protein n=1 Tax=Ascaris lumbricoides TaxID=6252 RepID=A0A0M3IPF2_ASCLU